MCGFVGKECSVQVANALKALNFPQLPSLLQQIKIITPLCCGRNQIGPVTSISIFVQKMNSRSIAIFVLCFIPTAPTIAAVNQDPLLVLKSGVPRPVGELIERIVNCNHWSGEEPYDEERKAQINQAVHDLRCSKLTQDERLMLKKYGKNARVRLKIKDAKETYQ